MERSFTRRGVLGATAGVFGVTALHSVGASQQGGGGDSERAPPDFDGFLDNVGNYDGSVADRRGETEVTVSVAVEANGGSFGFGPPAVHVDNGATVRWEWTGEGGAHNVVERSGVFDSGDVVGEAGHTFEHTFTDDGIYKYYCAPHEALGMRAAVVVGSDYPTRTPASTVTGTRTPEPTPTGDPIDGVSSTDWPSREYGATNRSFAPETTGPTDAAATQWAIQFDDAVLDPVLSDGTLYLSLWDRSGAVAVDAATGERRWERSVPGRVRATDGDRVYVTAENGSVFALNAETGETAWEWQDKRNAVHDLQIADGTVFAAVGEDLVTFDSATGDYFGLGSFEDRILGLGIADGTVYATGQTNFGSDQQDPELWVRAIDAEGGVEQWSLRRESYPPTRPTVTDETVFVGSRSHALHAIDRADGTERWTTEFGSSINGTAAVPTTADEPDGVCGTVYVGCNDYYLYAVDAESGQRRWRTRTRGSVNTPSVADGVVYATNRGYIHAGVDGDGDMVTETDGSVDRDKAVHAFDGATGQRLWTVDLDEQATTGQTPVYVGDEPVIADGALYVGLNTTDGTYKLYTVAETADSGAGSDESTSAATASGTPQSTPAATTTQQGDAGNATTTAGNATTSEGNTSASDQPTSGSGAGFTAVTTALGLLGVAGWQRWRDDDR